jgi:hypothetical protein
MLDILGRRKQMFIGAGGMVVTLLMIGGLIKRERSPNLFCPAHGLLIRH